MYDLINSAEGMLIHKASKSLKIEAQTSHLMRYNKIYVDLMQKRMKTSKFLYFANAMEKG